MGFFDFLKVPHAIKVGGAMVRTAEAAAAAVPPNGLQDAFANAYGLALAHLTLHTPAGERTSAEYLEIALACAARMEADRGRDGGTAFRARTRPVMVAMLFQAETAYGDLIREGHTSGREAILEALRRAG